MEYMYQLNNECNNIHKINDIYCSNCGNNNIDDTNNSCSNCYYGELYFVCTNCTEVLKLEDFYDLCPELILDKVIKIQIFYKKRIFIKKLINYRNSLLELYFHPKSIYINYYANNMLDDKQLYKQLAFINNKNELKLLKL